MMTPEDRYRRDPVFNRLVDLMQAQLEENSCQQYTPTELREAVILAATMYEYRHIRPITIRQGDEGPEFARETIWSRTPPRNPKIGEFGPSCGKVRIKDGWDMAGRVGTRLGFDVMCGQMWTPVLWEGEDDPDFYKTAGIDNL